MRNRLLRALALAAVLAVAVAAGAVAVGTPAGTIITNQATLTYKDANNNPMTPVTSGAVTTTVQQVAGADVTPAAHSGNAVSGQALNYAFTVTNTGNGNDTITLTTSGMPAGYTAVIYRDDNGDGIWQSSETTVVGSTGSLAHDAAYKIIVQVTVPAGAQPNETAAITLTAKSTHTTTVADTAIINVSVKQAKLAFTKSASTATPIPGDEIEYTISFENTGNDVATGLVITDAIDTDTTYVAGSIKYGASSLTDTAGDDAADFGHTTANTVTLSIGNLAAGASGTLKFKVKVIDYKAPGTAITNTAHAAYKDATGTDRTADTPVVTGSVQTERGIDVVIQGAAPTPNPSDTVSIPFTVHNTGNISDTFNVTETGTSLDWTLYIDVDKDGKLSAGDIAVTNPITLQPDQTMNLIAVVTVPAGTANGTTDTLTVTATSTTNGATTDSAQITTTVQAPVISLTKAVSAAQALPGDTLTYTLTIKNNGAGTAKDLVVTDPVPANTTYKPGSLKVNGATVADPSGTPVTTVTVSHASLAAGATLTIEFQVTIN